MTGAAVRAVTGGERRQDSVANALRRASAAAPTSCSIHDAARPFVSRRPDRSHHRRGHGARRRDCRACSRATRSSASRAGGDHRRHHSARDGLSRADAAGIPPRGPGGGGRARPIAASRRPTKRRSPSAPGYQVHVVDGDPGNVKITTADDLEAARQRMRPARAAGVARVGTGYDLHRLVEGRPLVIGGVTIPFDRGALGHSDGDVACHAATDAILGARGPRRHRPSLSRHRSALEGRRQPRAAARGGAAGARRRAIEIVNLDITVILERPKIKDAIDADARAASPARSASIAGARQHQGQDQRGRGRRRPRRGDRRARGRASEE